MDSTEEMGEREYFTVPGNVEPMRADRLLAIHFPRWSRVQIQRVLSAGGVMRDGKAISIRTKVQPGERLSIRWPEDPKAQLQPHATDFEVLFEDEDLLILNKPAGLAVHPGAGTNRTVVEGLLNDRSRTLAMAAGENRPGVVHRLDRETSGALMFAKTDRAYFALVHLFAERQIHKKYDAIVAGRPRLLSGSVQLPIGRSRKNRTKMEVRPDGRPARSDWHVEKLLAHGAAHLGVLIHSGRTHQIRVHLAHLGMPILGDSTYGFQRTMCPQIEIPRILLHATELGFCHPFSQRPIDIAAPFPADFRSALDQLSGNRLVKRL